MLESLVQLLNDLNPVATAFGIGGPLLATCLWLLRKIKIIRADHDHLLRRLELTQAAEHGLRRKLEGLAEHAEQLRLRTPDAALERANEEIASGNDERATRILAEYFESAKDDLFRIGLRLSSWHLSMYSDDPAAAIHNAERFCRLATSCLPNDREAAEMLAEIRLVAGLHFDQEGSVVAADDAWDESIIRAWGDPQEHGVMAAVAAAAAKAFAEHRNKLAWALYRRLARLLERSLGPWHLNTVAAKAMVGLTLRRLGRPHEAEPLIRQALTTFEHEKGANDFDSVVYNGDLAVTLRDMGNWAGAEHHYRKAIVALSARENDKHAAMYLFRHCHGMAHVCERLGQADSAQLFMRRAVSGNRVLFGVGSPQLINDLLCLSKVLLRAGRQDEAMRAATEALEMAREDADYGAEYAHLRTLAARVVRDLSDGSNDAIIRLAESCFRVQSSPSRVDGFEHDGVLSPS